MAKVPYSVLNKAELDLEKKFNYQFRFNHHGNQASVRVLPQRSYSELTPDKREFQAYTAWQDETVDADE